MVIRIPPPWKTLAFVALLAGWNPGSATPARPDVALPPTGTGSIATGWMHACALTAGGGAACWGNGNLGQLGTGLQLPAFAPQAVVNLTGATMLAAGASHSCALLANGAAKCWGYGMDGQLGGGGFTITNAPADVASLAGATWIAAGAGTTCAVLGSGGVKCWGRNDQGQLGDGSTTNRSSPVDVVGIGNAVRVAIGFQHACALLSTGAMKCWGRNQLGQLGDGTNTSSPTPVDVVGISGASALASGSEHACALLAGGAVKCWGSNGQGQLGNGSTTSSNVPVGVGFLGPALALAGGGSSAGIGAHTCAIVSNGTVSCWGYNGGGQLGTGGTASSSMPVAVSGLTQATAIATGNGYTCAATSDAKLHCWGTSVDGALGNGAPGTSPTALDVVGLSGATKIAAGYNHSCAIIGSGVSCWGNNSFGALGIGTTAASDSGPILRPTAGLGGAVAALSAGHQFSCAVLSGGSVQCWGKGDFANLGNGGFSHSGTPVNVLGISNAVAVGTGDGHACAVLADGGVRCWGSNAFGQLGDGTTTTRATPVVVGGVSGAIDVHAGYGHTCALIGNGTIKCWGRNSFGQLGRGGTSLSQPVPADVVGITNAVALSTGDLHTCAVVADGTARCWGNGSLGQLGAGNFGSVATPQGVPGLLGISSIAAGFQHSCATDGAGKGWCWGNNYLGQDGDGTYVLRASPVQVAGMDSATFASAGGHSCAMQPGGAAKCWGWNVVGQLGRAVPGTATTPVDVTDTPLLGFVLTYTAGAHGRVEGPSPQTLAPGANGQPVTAVADDHWHFAGWSDGLPSSVRTDTSVRADLAVAAQFANDTPVINFVVPPGAALAEGHDLVIQVEADDAESSAFLTFEFDCNGDGNYESGPSSSASYTCRYNAPGSITTRVRVTDPPGASAIAELGVLVTPVNDPPRYEGGDVVTVDEDSGRTTLSWATAISAGPPGESDEQGQTVHFEITGIDLPALFAIAPTLAADGTLDFQPAADANGSAMVSFRACDDGPSTPPNQNCTSMDTLTIVVNPVNDAPTVTLAPIPDRATSSGAQTVDHFAVADFGPPDEDARQSLVAWSVRVVSDPRNVLISPPTIDSAGALHFVTGGALGNVILEVTARDSGGTDHGGIDTSTPKQATLRTLPGVDLAIAIDNHTDRQVVGISTVYSIVVSNTGSFEIVGARLTDALPAALTGATWMCNQAQSTMTCPEPTTGTGDIDLGVSFRGFTYLRYELMATLAPGSSGFVDNTVGITAPAGVIETTPSDNGATDSDAIVGSGLFKDGFEDVARAAGIVAAILE